MKMVLKTIYLVCIFTTASGCASMTHYNNKETIDDKQAIFVDAKQRAIYAVNKEKVVSITEGEERSDFLVKFSGYCAEPSPDAISALAATLGLDLTTASGENLGIAQTIAEGVSKIGTRTAGIEALRDSMYRNCEAYAVGGISEFGLETLQRRFQTTMVGILAIEQLTGAVQAPPVTLVSDAGIGSPDAILDLTNKSSIALANLNTTKDEEKVAGDAAETAAQEHVKSVDALEAFKKDVERIKNMSEGDRSTEEKATLTNEAAELKKLEDDLEGKKNAKIDAEKLLAAAKDKRTKTQQAYEVIETSRQAAVTGGGKSSTNAIAGQLTQRRPLSDAAAEKVADAVHNIVVATTSATHWNEVCATLIGQYATKDPSPKSPVQACLAYLSAETQTQKDAVFKTFGLRKP